jgi:hypothetical protein
MGLSGGKGKNELKSFFDLKANKKCLCLISDGDCLTLSAVAATFASILRAVFLQQLTD